MKGYDIYTMCRSQCSTRESRDESIWVTNRIKLILRNQHRWYILPGNVGPSHPRAWPGQVHFLGPLGSQQKGQGEGLEKLSSIFRNMRRLQMDTAGFQFIPMFLWRCALLYPNVFTYSYSHPEKTCFQLFLLAVRTKLELDKAPWPEDNRICFLAAISASEILPALMLMTADVSLLARCLHSCALQTTVTCLSFSAEIPELPGVEVRIRPLLKR